MPRTVVEFRRRALPPPDDVLGCLREAIPALSRGALRRRLRRRGISRLPRDEEKASERQRSAETAIGHVHTDGCGPRPAEGEPHMFPAIGRASRFVRVAFSDANTRANGAAFLRGVAEAFPCRIHTHRADRRRHGLRRPAQVPRRAHGALDGPPLGHLFDRVRRGHGIGHRPTEPHHPWTNGRAERMNRTVEDAAIEAFHHPGLEAPKAHVLAFARASSSAKRLEALRWRTPLRAICDAWTKDPSIVRIDPHHLISGPNT